MQAIYFAYHAMARQVIQEDTVNYQKALYKTSRPFDSFFIKIVS